MKVGSMKRANRMLLVAAVVATVGLSGANASIFRHRKAEGKPAVNAAAVAGSTLNAIDGRFTEIVVITNLAAGAGVLAALGTMWLKTKTLPSTPRRRASPRGASQ